MMFEVTTDQYNNADSLVYYCNYLTFLANPLLQHHTVLIHTAHPTTSNLHAILHIQCERTQRVRNLNE